MGLGWMRRKKKKYAKTLVLSRESGIDAEGKGAKEEKSQKIHKVPTLPG